MPQYVLFLRDEPSRFSSYSPEDMQKLIQKYGDWRRSLANKIVGGHKLKDGEGHVLRQQSGKARVTDGPFTEAKEVMGGLFIIEADDYAQAMEMAKGCPHMEFGSIEVRAIEKT